MKLTYDPKYNVAYLSIKEGTDQVETVRISDELNIDLSPDGSIYGIEFLNANEQLDNSRSGLLEITNESSGESARIKISG